MERDEAKKKGYRYYYTGRPCKYGHFDYRLTSNFRCASCDKQYAKDNQGRIRGHKEKWYKGNVVPTLGAYCRICGNDIGYPSSGRMYCDKCRHTARKRSDIVRRRRVKDNLRKYKIEKGCSICGYNKCASALHFHHLDPTEKKRRVHSIYDAEKSKCIIVCANCHFEIHETEKEKGRHLIDREVLGMTFEEYDKEVRDGQKPSQQKRFDNGDLDE